MEFSWPDILSLLGALQGLLLSALLFSRTNNRRANRVLAAFTLVFSVGLLDRFLPHYLPEDGGLALLPDLLGGLVFLYGPLFYLYLRYLFQQAPSPREWLRHLSIFLIYSAFILYLAMRESLGLTPLPNNEDSGLPEFVLINLLFIQIFFYCYLTLRLISRQEKAFERDSPAASTIRWIKVPFLVLTAVYGLSYLGLWLAVFGLAVSRPLYLGVQVGSVVLVYLFSYRALAQPDMALEEEAREAPVKYQGSGLTEADKDRYLEQLLNYMDQQRPYLNPNLTIEQLARELGINRFYLSQLVNERLEKSFPDFINSYRTRETERLLLDPDYAHLNILAIAYEAGFNSKSTFNTAFKKATGMNPSQYRKAGQKKGSN